jgi:hypothetical protein
MLLAPYFADNNVTDAQDRSDLIVEGCNLPIADALRVKIEAFVW